MHVERAIELPETAERAWSLLTNWERQASWMPDADRIEVLTPHRAGGGVRIAVRTRILGVPAFTDLLEVTAWEPPHRLAVEHRRLVRGTGIWSLTPLPGGIRFTWTEEVSLPVPVLGELALAVYRPVLRWLMGRAMRGFRDYALASGPARGRPGSLGS